jgi:hypothetical protein
MSSSDVDDNAVNAANVTNTPDTDVKSKAKSKSKSKTSALASTSVSALASAPGSSSEKKSSLPPHISYADIAFVPPQYMELMFLKRKFDHRRNHDMRHSN